jgi:hypothetical protein
VLIIGRVECDNGTWMGGGDYLQPWTQSEIQPNRHLKLHKYLRNEITNAITSVAITMGNQMWILGLGLVRQVGSCLVAASAAGAARVGGTRGRLPAGRGA